jgi:hypothetical protein
VGVDADPLTGKKGNWGLVEQELGIGGLGHNLDRVANPVKAETGLEFLEKNWNEWRRI